MPVESAHLGVKFYGPNTQFRKCGDGVTMSVVTIATILRSAAEVVVIFTCSLMRFQMLVIRVKMTLLASFDLSTIRMGACTIQTVACTKLSITDIVLKRTCPLKMTPPSKFAHDWR